MLSPQFPLTPLECADPQNAPVTPLESADPKSLDLNFFRINRSKKRGRGWVCTSPCHPSRRRTAFRDLRWIAVEGAVGWRRSRGCGLAAKFAGEFGEETIHGDGLASQKSLQQGVEGAAVSGSVVKLESEESVDLPGRHALVEHGPALRVKRNVDILHAAAGVLGDSCGEFRVGESFRAIEFVSLAAVLAACEGLCSYCGDI